MGGEGRPSRESKTAATRGRCGGPGDKDAAVRSWTAAPGPIRPKRRTRLSIRSARWQPDPILRAAGPPTGTRAARSEAVDHARSVPDRPRLAQRFRDCSPSVAGVGAVAPRRRAGLRLRGRYSGVRPRGIVGRAHGERSATRRRRRLTAASPCERHGTSDRHSLVRCAAHRCKRGSRSHRAHPTIRRRVQPAIRARRRLGGRSHRFRRLTNAHRVIR